MLEEQAGLHEEWLHMGTREGELRKCILEGSSQEETQQPRLVCIPRGSRSTLQLRVPSLPGMFSKLPAWFLPSRLQRSGRKSRSSVHRQESEHLY